MTGQATQDFVPGEVNFENEARAQGWRPREEWTGDSSRWVDAETFVTRAQNWSGHLKKEIDELKSLMRQQAALNKKNQEALIQRARIREQELTAHIENLEAQRAQAISTSNGQEAVALERGIREANAELSQVKEQAKPAIDPIAAQVAADWRASNPWYGTDKDLTKECDFIGNTYGQMHPDEPLSDILDFTEKEMKRRHPELGGQVGNRPSGPQSGTVSGVRNVQSQDTSSTPKWEELDDDTKMVADGLIKKHVFKDRNAYLAAAAVPQDAPISTQYGVKKDVK
jgi:hypothetical protein